MGYFVYLDKFLRSFVNVMNIVFDNLQFYFFEKFCVLFGGVWLFVMLKLIVLFIGEFKYCLLSFVVEILVENLDQFVVYLIIFGLLVLCEVIVCWCEWCFLVLVGWLDVVCYVLLVNGICEVLFVFIQIVVCCSEFGEVFGLVVSLNLFYQIYEGVVLFVGVVLYYLFCCEENGFNFDFDVVDEVIWQCCQIFFFCLLGNFIGVLVLLEILKKLIVLVDCYDFVIVVDECYSEFYFDENVLLFGLFNVCVELGCMDFSCCVVFYSLFKCFNLFGLCLGFVVGDVEILKKFFFYCIYYGCVMLVQIQLVSIVVWNDEVYVCVNCSFYCEKFDVVLVIFDGVFDVQCLDGSFYLWVCILVDDIVFICELFEQQYVMVVLGFYLLCEVDGENFGVNCVCMVLVVLLVECVEVVECICDYLWVC